MRRNARLLVSLVSVLAVLWFAVFSAGLALAGEPAITSWQGAPSQSGYWFDAANWTAGVPGPDTWTYVDNGGTAVIPGLTAGPGSSQVGKLSPMAATAGMLYVGDFLGGSVEQQASLSVAGNIYLAPYGRGWGSYSLLDGKLSASNVFIGSGPSWESQVMPPIYYRTGGRFVQTGGQCVVGAGSTTAGRLFVGLQTPSPLPAGGQATPAADPSGAAPAGPGWFGAIYELDGGDLWTNSTYVGVGNVGQFVQSGGTHTVAGSLRVGGPVSLQDTGCASDATAPTPQGGIPNNGTYDLSDGLLKAGSIYVGRGGQGRFFQSGGTVDVAGGLYLGDSPSDVGLDVVPSPAQPHLGIYSITGGMLSAGSIEVASLQPWASPAAPAATNALTPPDASLTAGSTATMTQLGGQVKLQGELGISGGLCTIGTGTLSAQDVRLDTPLVGGMSWLDQSGGAVSVSGRLLVGQEHWGTTAPPPGGGSIGVATPLAGGAAVYSLRGGTLSAGSVELAGFGTSVLCQTGGRLDVSGEMDITDAGATYALRSGAATAAVLQVGGGLAATASGGMPALTLGGQAADLTVTNRLVFGANGSLTAEPGSTIQMRGASLANYSQTPDALAGLDSLRLVFSAGTDGASDLSTYEVAGKDLGFVRQGWCENFELETLQVGGQSAGDLKLVDLFKNQPGGDPEALYVRNLDVGPGSTLDLNGLHLYYLAGAIDPAAKILGGEPIRLPPSALTLLPGDLDMNGRVDAQDLLRLEAAFGMTGATAADGDMNGDGVVDATDYFLLKLNFGAVATDAAAPEPATLVLLGLGALGLLARRQRAPRG